MTLAATEYQQVTDMIDHIRQAPVLNCTAGASFHESL